MVIWRRTLSLGMGLTGATMGSIEKTLPTEAIKKCLHA